MKKLLLIATLTYINEIVGTRSELTIKKHPDFVGKMPATLFCDLTEQDYELVVEKHKNGQISTITPKSVEMGYVKLFHLEGDGETFNSPFVELTIPTDNGDTKIWFNENYSEKNKPLEDIIINTKTIDKISKIGIEFNTKGDMYLPSGWCFGGNPLDKSDLE